MPTPAVFLSSTHFLFVFILAFFLRAMHAKRDAVFHEARALQIELRVGVLRVARLDPLPQLLLALHRVTDRHAVLL